MSDISLQIKEPLYSRPLDQTQISEQLLRLCQTYPEAAELHLIGTSIRGEPIPALVLGKEVSSRTVVYIGGMDGSDWVSTSLLMRFASDYCRFWQDGRRLYSVSLPYLHGNRTICVIPRLNPDGAYISRRGPGTQHMDGMLARLCPDGDYSHWSGNGCGIPLRRSFTEEDHPETPETAALKQYLRLRSPALCLTLDSYPEEHREVCLLAPTEMVPRSKTIGRLLSRMAACPLEKEMEGDSLSRWFVREKGRPAFRYSLGADRSENGFYHNYASLREVLFSCPLLL